MALTNQDRVARALEQLCAGLAPFAERELHARLGPEWREDVSSRLGLNGELVWDPPLLLRVLEELWTGAFKFVLGDAERLYVRELAQVVSRHHGNKTFSSEDALRVLDTTQRLLDVVSAREEAEAVGELRLSLQRTIFAEQARTRTRQLSLLEGDPKAGLKPWREIVTPHRDVASGRYLQAEFAADLAQVHKGEGSAEYLDPQEFFRRTFITAGLRDLLIGALRRMTGGGGDPVLELQTNFGGGKTHSMLALYHLFSGAPSHTLEGLEPLLREVSADQAPKAHRAVLVGTALSPGKVSVKADGTRVQTLWGELAWQLGESAGSGAEGFAFVREADETRTSPGSDDLAALFRKFSPCLVLIDEWVAYARQLVGKEDLPAGNFDAQDSFAQALTEAAKRAPSALVVASIPQSKVEVGGEHGEHALHVLKDVFRRVAKAWRPASADEGFEIVRRRLFEPIGGREHFTDRDNVINAFAKLYRDNPENFPAEASEASYANDLRNAYPIHPELFKRLYEEWSTLDKFQRTRGVLRLLAKVIHRLWENQDQGLLILPAFVPLDDGSIKSELTTYLSDVWEPIISKDVDGPHSLPLELDRSNRNLGRYSASRRVARALYVGTAPGTSGANPGIGDQAIRLACVQPGEAIGTFGDALRYLVQRAQHVQHDGNRYWLSTRPNLNRMAGDRAQQNLREPEELYPEIIGRLRAERSRGQFARVHVCPETTKDIPDDAFEARLVVLGPKQTHQARKKDETSAQVAAKEFLAQRGNTPRKYRNTMVFVAPDHKGMEGLLEAVAELKAWESILDDKEKLDLGVFQIKHAESVRKEKDETVTVRLAATWCHALAPLQPSPTAEIEWDVFKLASGDSIAQRASAKLVPEEILLPEFAGSRLRMDLDKYLWTNRDHVSFAELADWYPTFLYLSRLKSADTLKAAIVDGAATTNLDDGFATADGYDEAKGRYQGLKVAQEPSQVTNTTLLVKPDVARRQRQAEAAAEAAGGAAAGAGLEETGGAGGAGVITKVAGKGQVPPKPAALLSNVFFGSASIDPLMVGMDAAKIAEEVLQHLTALPGAKATVKLELHVEVPDGIPKKVEADVSENCVTLKLDVHEFGRQ